MKTSKALKKMTFGSLVLLVLIILPFSSASAFSTAARYPVTGADVTGVGTITWTNPGNIAADDNAYATATLTSGTTSHYLRGTNFGFTIPTNATITGIVVEIGRYTSGRTTPLTRDNIVRLVKAGAIVGTNNAVTGTDWPAAEGIATYSPTDPLWGTTWTPDEINANNFGVVLSAINSNGTRSRTATVDYMRITVSYKLTPTLSITNSPVTYNASQQAATVSGSVSGTVSSNTTVHPPRPPTPAPMPSLLTSLRLPHPTISALTMHLQGILSSPPVPSRSPRMPNPRPTGTPILLSPTRSPPVPWRAAIPSAVLFPVSPVRPLPVRLMPSTRAPWRSAAITP